MTTTAAPLALDTIVFARGLTTEASSSASLQAVDIDILPGEIFSIVGRAGSGKTALLEALVGLRRAAAAHLEVCGADPRRFPAAVKQQIGVAPRHAELERALTVEEALRLLACFYDRADAERAIAWLALQEYRRQRVDHLPAAVRQRLSLALAVLHDPVVLFADEPTRELDPEGSALVWELLRQRRQRGRTTVLTTNHLDEAARLSDRVAVLRAGRIVATDAPAALVSRSSAPQQITFELLPPMVPIETVSAVDGVIQVRRERAVYHVTSSDGVMTLRGILRLLDTLGCRPLSLELRQRTLEDTFFELTA